MRAFFVTGTDTAVGKTTVSLALLAAARGRGLRVAALKPIETGCTLRPDGSLFPADADLLRRATGRGALDDVCTYRLEAALAPLLAARRAGATIDLARIASAAAALVSTAPDLLLVEGAGGLLVPLTPEATIADLALLLGHPLVIVARESLGTINHTSLTIESARSRGLEVTGVIMSASHQTTDPGDTTAAALEITRLTGAPVLGRLPYLPGADLETLGRAAESTLALDVLLPPAPSR